MADTGAITRGLVWEIDETAGFDTAWATLDGRRLRAEGRTAGLRPEPYWLTYELETGDEFVTARLTIDARWATGSAELVLERLAHGWMANGVPRPDLAAALDCDLGACPLTNTMPVLRHDLLVRPGDHELLMAFVEVPGLRVVPSHQRYTHLSRERGGGARVRYRSGSFASDLTFDADGFVVDYPQLGRRVIVRAPAAGIRAEGPGSVRPG